MVTEHSNPFLSKFQSRKIDSFIFEEDFEVTVLLGTVKQFFCFLGCAKQSLEIISTNTHPPWAARLVEWSRVSSLDPDIAGRLV